MCRKARGFSLTELAEKSGVDVRSIQMCEQRNKGINYAAIETVYRLARALHCNMEDLMEL